MKLPALSIRGRTTEVPIMQGGMGIGISLSTLAGAVAYFGGVGVISSAALNHIVSVDLGRKVDSLFSLRHEVEKTYELTQGAGIVGVNIMRYLDRDFKMSVMGAVEAKADMIICGAGLPITLPEIVGKADTALVPIVSSLRALKIIHKKWSKKKRRPDAVVIEGPLAGGHLGFTSDKLWLEENTLEKLFPPIKEFVIKNGDYPVIVAGGIYTHQDIVSWIQCGADGVQLGTRFLATEESGASNLYKNAVVQCKKEDIVVCHNNSHPPGSPSGMPFRTLKDSSMIKYAKYRKPLCNRGYVLQKNQNGKHTKCAAKDDAKNNFCICNGLLASCGYILKNEEAPLYTVGTSAHRVSEIVSVQTLMNELTGLT